MISDELSRGPGGQRTLSVYTLIVSQIDCSGRRYQSYTKVINASIPRTLSVVTRDDGIEDREQ